MKKKCLEIKDFEESKSTNRNFERVLFHELLHSTQTKSINSLLNLEIEVRIAIYMYCQKYGILLGEDCYKSMGTLKYTIDEGFNIIDVEIFNESYINYIKELQGFGNYKNYKESSSARNLETIQRLAKDCK